MAAEVTDPIRPTFEFSIRMSERFDVLMDGFTWFAGIKTFAETYQVALALAAENPDAHVQIHTVETKEVTSDRIVAPPGYKTV